MTTLGVVLYCIICAKTDPLWKGAVLPLLFSKRALSTEGFLRRLQTSKERIVRDQQVIMVAKAPQRYSGINEKSLQQLSDKASVRKLLWRIRCSAASSRLCHDFHVCGQHGGRGIACDSRCLSSTVVASEIREPPLA